MAALETGGAGAEGPRRKTLLPLSSSSDAERREAGETQALCASGVTHVCQREGVEFTTWPQSRRGFATCACLNVHVGKGEPHHTRRRRPVRTQTLAHLSDLHIGHGPRLDDAALRLREALLTEQIDHAL